MRRFTRIAAFTPQGETPMFLMDIIIYLVLIGVLLWLINSFVPMAPVIKGILNVVVALVVIVWLMRIFGLFSGAPPPY
jgi:hypothetical protein